MSGIAIIGAGDLGKIVLDILISMDSKDEIEGFYDDNKEGEYLDFDIMGDVDDVDEMQRKIVAIGDVKTRKEIFDRYREQSMMFEVALHRTTVLSYSSNMLGAGTIVKSGVVLGPETDVGVNCIIGNNSTLCHDVGVSHHSRIAPGVTICGHVDIGEEVYLCPGVTVDKDVSIADAVTVLSGTTVYKDIDTPGVTVSQEDI